MTMDDSTKLEYEAWRRATVVPAHVERKEEGAQRMLGAPFEAFVKAAWLAGWQARDNQT
jgi:hypothetical protein